MCSIFHVIKIARRSQMVNLTFWGVHINRIGNETTAIVRVCAALPWFVMRFFVCVINFCICLITRCRANRKTKSIQRNEAKNKYYILNDSGLHWFLSLANSVNESEVRLCLVCVCGAISFRRSSPDGNKSGIACYFSQVFSSLAQPIVFDTHLHSVREPQLAQLHE